MTSTLSRGCNDRVMVHRVEKTVVGLARETTRHWDTQLCWVVGWVLAAVWALGFPLVSHLETHRVWGLSAGIGYAGAAMATCWKPGPRARTAGLAIALAGAVVLPLTYLVLTGAQQSEVGVIERSGVLMLHQATPYLAHPHHVVDYTPYLPGMSLFGMPRALLDEGAWPLRLLGDARLWCALVFISCLWAGRRVLGPSLTAAGAARPGRLPYGTAMAVLTASPPVALALCVSGVDLPLAGLCCLALAFAARGRYVAAGLTLAAACSLKWTAWPAVAVAVALVGCVRGGRAAWRCAGVAVTGTLVVVLPSALLSPAAMVQQVIAFPTGRGGVETPADSPLPGHLLTALGPAGWYAAVGLLLIGALVVIASLIVRPPADATSAARRLAIGLCVGFLLAPAGRFGYLALPVVLVVWAGCAAPERHTRVVGSDVSRTGEARGSGLAPSGGRSASATVDEDTVRRTNAAGRPGAVPSAHVEAGR